jgi:hypothetical protein
MECDKVSFVSSITNADVRNAEDATSSEVTNKDEIMSYINRFNTESTAIKKLTKLMTEEVYQKKVYLKICSEGKYKDKYVLCFEREHLIKILKHLRDLNQHIGQEQGGDIIITSFERSLKHQGFFVTKTTHGGAQIKEWMHKEDADESDFSASKQQAKGATRRNMRKSKGKDSESGGVKKKTKIHRPKRKRARRMYEEYEDDDEDDIENISCLLDDDDDDEKDDDQVDVEDCGDDIPFMDAFERNKEELKRFCFDVDNIIFDLNVDESVIEATKSFLKQFSVNANSDGNQNNNGNSTNDDVNSSYEVICCEPPDIF